MVVLGMIMLAHSGDRMPTNAKFRALQAIHTTQKAYIHTHDF